MPEQVQMPKLIMAVKWGKNTSNYTPSPRENEAKYEKIVTQFFIVFLVLLSSALGVYSKEDRTAIIVDKKGITTEASNLSYQFYGNAPDKWENSVIGVSKKQLDIIIPIDHLISVKEEAENWQVKYQWKGEEKIASGSSVYGLFRGQSDFGDFKLDSPKLRKLAFKEAPSPVEQDYRFNTKLVFVDGTEMIVADLNRYYADFSSYTGWNRPSSRSITFERGESVVTVNFEKIKTINFTSEMQVSVTLKNSKSASGKLEDMLGLLGVFSEGYFLVEPKNVKRIEFGLNN